MRTKVLKRIPLREGGFCILEQVDIDSFVVSVDFGFVSTDLKSFGNHPQAEVFFDKLVKLLEEQPTAPNNSTKE